MAATYSSLVGLAVGGKYEIRRVIGAGGMGVVCEAEHLDLGKRVAVKLIDKSMKESESIIARFKREAKAAGRIQSEHIVDVFDVNADARVGLYMVMEHLSGEDLQARIERDRRIDVKTAVMIAHQIARGLSKAHAAGVIHRDLKPANVFLTQRDNGQLLVKLLDFGVSKLLLDTKGDARITGSGTPIGTPLYMSPEQAEGKDDVDGRADIWSLGAVLYEALAGVPPFADRGSYHGTIVGILTSRPKLLHDAAPWVPAELAKVVDAMLVHDRDARIPDAAAVTQRLLDAFPQVLPDGTGRHTAVIVPQTQASVDATGDTEIFTSAALGGLRVSNTPVSAPAPSKPPASSGEDSTKTVPDPVSSKGDALRTAAATPVDAASRPREEATSSSQGVSLPATPPDIDPLPASELAPVTTRDDELALRAERRRYMTMGLVALAITGVAAGGYVAGRRAAPEAPSAVHAVTPPASLSAPAATSAAVPPAPPEPPASAEAPPAADVPSAAVSALPSATSRHERAPVKKEPRHAAAASASAASTATASAEEAPAPTPKPAPSSEAPTPYDEPPTEPAPVY